MPAALAFFEYWGKARPLPGGADLHLLPYHSLDVAAVGRLYLNRRPALLGWMQRRLGGPSEAALLDWFTFWLALHDLGKFSISFQAQRLDLVWRLQQSSSPIAALDGVRHDSLGMWFWSETIEPMAESEAWFGNDPNASTGIAYWARAVTGHHGQPPLAHSSHLDRHFRPRDAAAARDFVRAARALWLTPEAASIATQLDTEAFETLSRDLSWWVAGIAVLADWIGSNAEFFPYCDQPTANIDAYWHTASTRAETALRHCGVLPPEVPPPEPFERLFPLIGQPSPLQAWAANVPLSDGAQIHLLEDVTGAGKTEAAMMLAHRLVAAGVADGFFVGMPTMATANAMYGRIGNIVHRLFPGDASYVLAHANKKLVEEFAASIIEPGTDEADPHQLDETATRRCARWLADHNKRALLAPVGVGTVDQALLGALQSKHQSLRLLGLARKVLIVDEVHACDDYMQQTLAALLAFHARAEGSVILLSATLPRRAKAKLLDAFASGSGAATKCPREADATAYPLTTRWSAAHPGALVQQPVATRAAVKRTVRLRYESDRGAIVAMIVAASAAGRCVAWIRNTVGDALDAHDLLSQHLPPDRLTLFHARYALGDRLDIEDKVLGHFGAASGAADRQGQVLVATQVAEMSLDVDFDVVVTDLCPIDRLIQRAGRLCRHLRDAGGSRLSDASATDGRGEPCLWVFAPPWSDKPPKSWLAGPFARAAKVYPNHVGLWRTARIVRGGSLAMPDDARHMIEGVYGSDEDMPPGLQAAAERAEGRAYGDRSEALRNTVKPNTGYVRSNMDWSAEVAAPSRLGEETIDVLLARWVDDEIVPWRHDKPAHAWAYSTAKVAKRLIAQAAPAVSPERANRIEQVLATLPGAGRWIVLMALEPNGTTATATALAANGQVSRWQYDARYGLARAANPHVE